MDIIYQPFERGHMLWLSNVGWYEARVIYVMLDDTTYARYDDTYSPGDDSTRGPTPPEGLLLPTGSLGKVWRTRRGLADRVGFATGPSVAEAGSMHMFVYGEMVSVASLNMIAVFRRGDPNMWVLYAAPPG